MNALPMEQQVYRAAFEDGQLETFVGAGLVLLGVGWLGDQVALSGIAPAVLVSVWAPVRTRFIAPRAGTVQFSSDRKRQERSGFLALLLAGTATLGLALVVYFTRARSGESLISADLVRGLPAALIGFGALMSGWVFGLGRIAAYALPLLVAAAAAIIFGFDPGWAFLGAGIPILGAGIGLLVRFLRTNPVINEAS